MSDKSNWMGPTDLPNGGRQDGNGSNGTPLPDDAADGGSDPVLDQLQQLFQDVANEPLPERLLKLLEDLDKAERDR